ncbi:hypothetical protein pb186bvf_001665 [Paramecium bursaria]
MQRYQQGDLVFEDQHSRIYRGFDQNTQESVAIKIVKNNAPNIKDIKEEVVLAQKFNHDNIERVIETFEKGDEFVIVKEFDEANLSSIIKNNGGAIVEDAAQEVLQCVAKALKAIHEAGYIFRNVRPDNVAVVAGQIKIKNFTYAVPVNGQRKPLPKESSSALYESPQVLELQQYTVKADIWSLGLLAYEIVYGKGPWVSLDANSYIHNVYSTPLRFPIDVQISEQYKSFIKSALTVDESKRLSLEEVLKHPALLVEEELRQYSNQTVDQRSKEILATIQSAVQAKGLNFQQQLELFDADKNGSLDQFELFSFLHKLDPTVTTDESNHLFQFLDQSGDGQISQDEFKRLFQEVDFSNIDDVADRMIFELKEIVKANKLDLSRVFLKYDLDKQGDLGIQEFGSFVRSFAPSINNDSIKQIFNKFDADHNFRIDFNEFRSALIYGTDGHHDYDPKEEKYKKIQNQFGILNTQFSLDFFRQKYQYQEADQISKGSNYSIYKGVDLQTGQPVAIKIIDTKLITDAASIDALKQTIAQVSSINHPNVVKLLDVFGDSSKNIQILELCNEGSLASAIQQAGQFSETQAVQALQQIVSGFQELNKRQLGHYNLRPQNIFIKEGLYKLSGLQINNKGQNLMNIIQAQIKAGLQLFISPQILEQKQYTAKADIWSIGLIAYYLIYGRQPWPSRSLESFLTSVKSGQLRFPYNIQVSDQYKDFIKQALVYDEAQRIDFPALFTHPVFKTFANQRTYSVKEIDFESTQILYNIQKTVQARGIDIQAQFKKYDQDHSGTLNKAEFQSLLKDFDPTVTSFEFNHLYQLLDSNNDGSFSSQEFQTIFLQLDFVDSADKSSKIVEELREIIKGKNLNLQRLFIKYDRLMTGQLSASQFQDFLREIAPSLSKIEIDSVFSLFDKDGSGSVNFGELKAELIFATPQDTTKPVDVIKKKVFDRVKRKITEKALNAHDLAFKFGPTLTYDNFKWFVGEQVPLTEEEYKQIYQSFDIRSSSQMILRQLLYQLKYISINFFILSQKEQT